jgi:hypothetical protein
MIIISKKSTGAGIRKLSELEIDIDKKNWMGYSIDNLKGVSYSGIFSINAWGMNFDLNGAVLWMGGDAGELRCEVEQTLDLVVPRLDVDIGGAHITFDYLGGDNVLNIISSADISIRGLQYVQSSSVMGIHAPQLWLQLDPAGWLRFRYDDTNNEIVIDKVLPLLINDQSGTDAWTRWRYDSANNEIVIESGLPIRIPNLVGGGGGITKLSQLEIDTDKDWSGHYITNTPMTGYVYSPDWQYSLSGYYNSRGEENPINNLINASIVDTVGVMNIHLIPNNRIIYSVTGDYNGVHYANMYYYSNRIMQGVFNYNPDTSQYEEILLQFLGIYEGVFREGGLQQYGVFTIGKNLYDPNPVLDIKIPITDNVSGTGYFHVNSDEVTINTLTGDITLNPSGVVDFSQSQSANFVIENYDGEPSDAVAGRIIFNTQTGQFEGYDGTSWIQFGGGGSGGVNVLERWTTSTRPSNPVEGQIGYNTDTHQFEGWNGSSWVILG